MGQHSFGSGASFSGRIIVICQVHDLLPGLSPSARKWILPFLNGVIQGRVSFVRSASSDEPSSRDPSDAEDGVDTCRGSVGGKSSSSGGGM